MPALLKMTPLSFPSKCYLLKGLNHLSILDIGIIFSYILEVISLQICYLWERFERFIRLDNRCDSQALSTDNEKFEEIALPHLDTVYRAAFALCGRPQDADDLTQTTLLKAFERFDSFTPGTNCKAWLLQILRNNWIDQLRHKKIVGPVLSVEEEMIAERTPSNGVVWSNAQDLL